MSYRYSVIIPHYNDPDRLGRLISSLPLERNDIEILVIDDCSPDQRKLDGLRSTTRKIKWHTTKKNSGAGAARNIGLKHAKGEFLVFADSDDKFTNDAFEIMDTQTQDNKELYYFLAEAVQEGSQVSSNRADLFNNLCIIYLNEQNKKT